MTTAQKERILKADRRKDLQILIDVADSRTARLSAEAKWAEQLSPVYAADLRGAILNKKESRLEWPK